MASRRSGETKKKEKNKGKTKGKKKANETNDIEEYLYWTTEFSEEEVLAFFNKHGFKYCDDDMRFVE